MYFFSSKGTNNYTDIDYPDDVFIVFGRETAGLPKELLDANIEHTLRIPMLPTLRCLNLSNAVAIAVYEVLRQWNFDGFV